MSSVYCSVCSPPKVNSLVTFIPLLTSSPSHSSFPSCKHHTVICVFFFFFLLIPSPFSPRPQNPFPCNCCWSVLCIYNPVSILFVSLCCALNSTESKIIWYLYISDWLITLTLMLYMTTMLFQKVRFSCFLYLCNSPLNKCITDFC